VQRNRSDSRRFDGADEDALIERVVFINRNSKVVKGGRRFSFSAIMVVGDGEGRVGVAKGKANEVPEAIRKGNERARKAMVTIPLQQGTLPHAVIGQHGSARVLLKPAGPGTGVIAGGPARAVLEAAGVQNVLTKCLGSRNPFNVALATLNGLTTQVSADMVAKRRGIDVSQLALPRHAREALAGPPPAPAAKAEAPASEAKAKAPKVEVKRAAPKPKPKPKAKPKAEAEPKPKTEAAPEAEADPKPETEAAPEAEAAPGGGAPGDRGAGDGGSGEATPEADAPAEAEAAAAPDAEEPKDG